ncbi:MULTISPECIES: hypothetical protein [Gemella]|nr:MULTISPECIES: hypothetical protein [Gemella]
MMLDLLAYDEKMVKIIRTSLVKEKLDIPRTALIPVIKLYELLGFKQIE